MSRPALLLVAALLSVACGSGEPETAATTTTSPTVTTSVATPTTTTLAAPGSTAPETNTTRTTTAPDRYEIIEGQFQGPEKFVVMIGETFVIEVVSDVPGQLHIHGYDLLFELVAGEPNLIELAPSTPGVFEVELEGSHTHLFDIEVSG